MKGVEMLLAPMVEIFCDIDDFCKHHEENNQLKLLPNAGIKKRDRKPHLSVSKIMKLMIFFHLSHYRTFKDFYMSCVLKALSAYFPKAVSYERFFALTPRVLEPLTAYVLSKTGSHRFILYGLH
jgi:hypothetical protein